MYVEGSFFGDIEQFRKSLRLFSVKAEEDLILAAIKRDDFNRIISMNPTFSLMVFGRTLQRYIKVKTSIEKATVFKKLPVNNCWWDLGLDDATPINSKISDWLDLVKDHQQMKLNGSVGAHSSVKSFVLRSVSSISKARKSIFGQADKQLVATALENATAKKQDAKKKSGNASLEGFLEQLRNLENKLTQLSTVCNHLGRDQDVLDERCTAFIIEVLTGD